MSPGSRWERAWHVFGLAGGALYLVALPVAHVTALRSIGFAAALIAAVALWAAPTRRALLVLAAFVPWLAAAGLSLVSSRDISASLAAIENDILRSAIVFIVFYMLTRRLAALRLWVNATALGFFVLSAAAVMSFFAHGEWRSHYVPALQNYATAAVTVLPLLAGHLLLRSGRRVETWLLTATVALILAAGYLTMSRAFWLVLICGALVALALHARRIGRLKRSAVALVSVACLLALSAAALVAMQRARSVIDVHDRAAIYSAAIAKIARNPLTGSGYGHETDAAWYAAALPDWSVFHAHNLILSFTEQMGAMGLVALAAIFLIPAAVLWRAMKTRAAASSDAALCALVLLVCIFVKNNLDYFFFKQSLWLFFAHLGIYLGQVDRALAAAGAPLRFDGLVDDGALPKVSADHHEHEEGNEGVGEQPVRRA